jgi:hypothetical protein
MMNKPTKLALTGVALSVLAMGGAAFAQAQNTGVAMTAAVHRSLGGAAALA